MQNSYTGDIGDFGKFALLKALAGSDLRLGVHWYLNEDEEGSKRDGGLTDYEDLKECDPPLYDKLQTIVESRERQVSRVEQIGVLPAGTIFYSDPLRFRDLPLGNRPGRASLRKAWNDRALDAMAGADIVFLDPDNGIAGKLANPNSISGNKYVFPDEMEPYVRRGQSLIVYQRQTREKGGVDQQIESKLARLSFLGIERPWAWIFRRRQVRVYFVLPAAAHGEKLADRSRAFAGSRWVKQGHFELRGLGFLPAGSGPPHGVEIIRGPHGVSSGCPPTLPKLVQH